MGKFTNSYVLETILKSLYHVAGRRTTQGFAAKVIGSIIKTLEQKYPFLEYVNIDDHGEVIEEDVISISSEINNVPRNYVGRAIEAIIRVIYMDIIGKAGLFFIAELKRRSGDELMQELNNFGVDLASLQVEMHYLYRSRERKKQVKTKRPYGDVSLLGYTWKNVSTWKYNQVQKTCVLYNKNGEVLDTLHLETIIENYVKNLSDALEEIPEETKKELTINNKELELLKMLHQRDIDVETAIHTLHITKIQFDNMIKKLLEKELLQYTSFNIIELTEFGINYLSKKDEEDSKSSEITEEAQI